MSTNPCHTIHFLVDAVTANTTQLASLTSVKNMINTFGADLNNSLRGTGPITPSTTLMPDGITESSDAISQISGVLITNQQINVFNNLLVGNCFGSNKVFIPDITVYGTPGWVQGAGVINLTAADLYYGNRIYPVYDNALITVDKCLASSIVRINNSITTALALSERVVLSSTVCAPNNVVGRVLEVNEALWNALPTGSATTAGETKYNVMGRYLLQVLNHSSTLVNDASHTLFNNSTNNRFFSARDISDMQDLWKHTYRSSFYQKTTFAK